MHEKMDCVCGTKRRRCDVAESGQKRARLHETTVRQLQAEVRRLRTEIDQLQNKCTVYRAHIVRAYVFIQQSAAVPCATPTLAVPSH